MKKFIASLLIVLVIITGAVSLFACSNKTEDDSTLIGFDTEVARAVCEKLGIKASFQEIEWNTKEIELNGKSIDAIWNGMTLTAERSANMSMSVSYLVNKQVLVYKTGTVQDGNISNPQAVTMVAEAGSAGEELYESQYKAAGFKYTSLTAQRDIFTEILSGTADIGIMDSVMANYYVNTDGSTFKGKIEIYSDLPVESETYAIGFRKGETMLTYKVNNALYELQQEGKIKEIAETYGLTSALVTIEKPVEPTSDDGSWTYIQNKGTLIVGYTLFAPIAYKKD